MFMNFFKFLILVLMIPLFVCCSQKDSSVPESYIEAQKSNVEKAKEAVEKSRAAQEETRKAVEDIQ